MDLVLSGEMEGLAHTAQVRGVRQGKALLLAGSG
jgi:hypothetical protein